MADQSRRRRQGAALDALTHQLQSESSDGIELLHNPCNNGICALEVEASIPALRLQWKRYATSCQLRFVHECILRMLKEQQLSKLLADDTGLATISAEDQGWIIHDWMPRVIHAGLRTVATKCPASHFGHISACSVHEQAPAGLTIRRFEDMESARAWLATAEG